MELRRYWGMFCKWWWMIAVGVLLSGGTSYFASKSMTPIYAATVTLRVNQTQSPGAQGYDDFLLSELLGKTYTELVPSRPVLEQVARELGLGDTPDGLGSQVSVSSVRDTQLLRVTVRNRDPQLAATVANKIAEVFAAQIAQSQGGQISDARQSLLDKIKQAEGEIANAASALQSIRSGASGPPSDSRTAEESRLQASLSQYQLVYSQLIKSDQDLALAQATSGNAVQVAIPAFAPGAPVEPKVLQNTLLAVLLGLLLTAGIAFLIEYLDDTVKNSEDVRRATTLPTFGIVGVVPVEENGKRNGNGHSNGHSNGKGDGNGKGDKKPAWTLATDPKSHFGEAYRMVRTNLQYAMVDNPCKTLLVTSAGPNEGKSFTMSNLAVVLAQAGHSVIVVDSDIRRPTLHKIFGAFSGMGLANLLLEQDQTDLTPYLQQTDQPGLRVMTSGRPLPPNPTELLISPQMGRVVAALKREADIVLFDSPPVLSVADATILGGMVDGVLLVIDSGRNRAEVVRRAKEALGAPGSKVLGAILNRFQVGSDGYYYYYYYNYRYRYANPKDAPREANTAAL